MMRLLLTRCRIGVQILIDHAVALALDLNHSSLAVTMLVDASFFESASHAIVRASAPATV